MIRLSPRAKSANVVEAGPIGQSALTRLLGDVFKRLGDVAISALVLVFLAPIFVLIALRIKRDSPGPVFYRGLRAGRNGKLFGILKFRTMYECEASYRGPRVTGCQDPRITPFGHWLRDTKLNELPQFWNVLVGEMSLVGPRPEDVKIAEDWPINARREILSVRPGITSPASILYRDEEKLLTSGNVMSDYLKSILPDKMRLDRLYVRNRSLFIDLDTLFWTIFILVPQIVRPQIPETRLFAGPSTRLIGRNLSWFVVDLLVALGAAVTAAILWRNQQPLNWGIRPMIGVAILISFLFSGINALSGINRIVWSEAFAEDGASLALSAGSVTLLVCLLNYLQEKLNLLPYPALPTTMIFTMGLMSGIGFVATRYRSRLLTGLESRWLLPYRTARVIERVLIVGRGESYQLANWLLKQGDAAQILSVVGVIDDEEPALVGMRIKGNLMLGGTAELPEIIKKYDVGVVLFAQPKSSADLQERIKQICHAHGARLVMLTDLLEVLHKQLTQPVKPHGFPPSSD